MKRTMIGLMLATVLFTSCISNEQQPTADEKDTQKQEQLQREAQAQSGLPAIHNFQEKKLLKQIYELRDNEKLVCYAYLYNEIQGKLVFIGKCIGYGIPYSTQYSNPQKLVRGDGGQYHIDIPMTQAEPNGLFMPSSSEGTWIMLIDSEGTPHPVYVEPRVIVSPFKLSIN